MKAKSLTYQYEATNAGAEELQPNEMDYLAEMMANWIFTQSQKARETESTKKGEKNTPDEFTESNSSVRRI